jgi:hypothetical protein
MAIEDRMKYRRIEAAWRRSVMKSAWRRIMKKMAAGRNEENSKITSKWRNGGIRRHHNGAGGGVMAAKAKISA